MQLLYYYMCGECGKSPLAYDKSKRGAFLYIMWINYCRKLFYI